MYYEELYPLNEEHCVYLVRDTQDGRVYVKKILSVYDAQIYHSLAKAPVKGLPRIVSVSEDKVAGTLIVVEEYISGKTIEELIDNGRVFDEKETAGYIISLCGILRQLHFRDKPVIHRDIKPSNVMLADDGRIVLIDMNAGRFDNGEASRDTRLIGTGGYAAPEQYGFGSSGPYTDIYGVGMLMKAMLTGDVTLQTEYDGSLKTVLQKCSAVDKENRYPDVLQLMDALSGTLSEAKDHSKKRHAGKYVAAAVAVFLLIALISLYMILSQKTGVNTHPEGGYFSARENEISLPNVSSDVLDELCTSYKGTDGSGLTLKRDGSAVYYSEANQYSEILCPWKYENGRVIISLSKLQCEISAEVSDDDFSNLYFTADSKNWNDEEFVRLDRVDEKYEKGAMTPYDKKVYVNKSGCPEFVFGDIAFEIPKKYSVYPQKRYPTDYVIFTLANADEKSEGSVAVTYTDYDDFDTLEEFFPGAARSFGADFMENVESVGEMQTYSIGEHKLYAGRVKGNLNKGFGYSVGKDTVAFVVFICDEENGKLIRLIMTSSKESTIMDKAENASEDAVISGEIRIEEDAAGSLSLYPGGSWEDVRLLLLPR
ncbi:MAG: serine/threonine protein kinase [Lachnospiraceae bacterium]|nr:serine/threonine protein kinase [Lachnospiraceae bacterium]